MATKSGEVKLKKNRRPIPEVNYRLKVIRVHEAVCMDCGEIVKESTEGYRSLLGKHTCGICGAKFRVVEAPTREDGRGRVVNKDLARGVILNLIRAKGPISARGIREDTKLNSVATRKIITSLSEEELIQHTTKGWIRVE